MQSNKEKDIMISKLNESLLNEDNLKSNNF